MFLEFLLYAFLEIFSSNPKNKKRKSKNDKTKKDEYELKDL